MNARARGVVLEPVADAGIVSASASRPPSSLLIFLIGSYVPSFSVFMRSSKIFCVFGVGYTGPINISFLTLEGYVAATLQAINPPRL